MYYCLSLIATGIKVRTWIRQNSVILQNGISKAAEFDQIGHFQFDVICQQVGNCNYPRDKMTG